MELRYLRCLVAVADHGTFTEAAATLHLSQPALSHAIARLEHDLDAKLFERTPAGAKLTAAGTALLGHARRAIAEADSGRAAVVAVTGVLSGELRVVGIKTAVVETGHLVAQFHTRHPGVHLVVEEPAGPQNVIEHVRGGRCDVGIVRSSHIQPDLGSVLAGAQDMVAIFPESLAPKTQTVTERELGTFPYVAPLFGTTLRGMHDVHFRALDVDPHVVAECSNVNTLFELVRGGVGASLTSKSLADAVDTTGIAIRPLRPRTQIELWAIYRRAVSPAVEAFCAMMNAASTSNGSRPSRSSHRL